MGVGIVCQRMVCHFSGRVQGVGFRYTVKNLAMRYNVRGHVRNLPDGRVELLMEGDDQEMQRLVNDIKSKMNCFITRIDQSCGPATGEHSQFLIRY